MRSCVLLIAYMALAWFIGEVHPFSRFPMYDQFPASAKAFQLKDSKGEVVSMKKVLGIGAADFSHNYYAALDAYGGGSAVTAEEQARAFLANRYKTPLNLKGTDSFVMWSINYIYEQDTIARREVCLFQIP